MSVDSVSDSDYEVEYEAEDVEVGGGMAMRVMTLVPPPLEFMARLHSKSLEVSSRVVWTGSLLLCRHIMGGSLRSAGRAAGKCLELGAGTGIVGMALCKMGIGEAVVMTDGDDEALRLLRINIEMNELDVEVPSSYYWGGEEEPLSKLSSWCTQKYPSLDWDGGSKFVSFDNIFAADVLYKSSLPALFFSSVATLLGKSGVLHLCHIPRAGVSHDMVVAEAEECGLEVLSDEEPYDLNSSLAPMPPSVKWEDAVRARVYKIAKGKGT